ncbi:AAA domain-containing protein [Cellulomonas wangsupingiae]|uniref:AAA domain-containing protein n=1 Tax=Cellulomonas wangsupingiae TaxID=2968085 RepID=UPI001D0E655B|nr:AAA domain-containing protein [Cellulomonas wangsupingiae]MCM0639520.1 AAA domain-containing protein [Cellulomonas wangsupingiae]
MTEIAQRHLLPIVREELITGRADVLSLTTQGRAFLGTESTQDVVLYGWPVVITHDGEGRAVVAPLFLTELETGAAEGTAVPCDDEPYLNPALLSEEFASADQIADAQAAIVSGIGFGDAQAVAAAARRIAESLGHPVLGDLDPDALQIPPVPDHGVHNVACLVRGPSQVATRALIDELTELRGRTDWSTTAAAPLTRFVEEHGPTDVATPTAALPPSAFEGLTLNDSQEEAVAAALSRDLTVVTGPPGTGKSQLVASVVANQWLAGRSVLVASTNNGAVDVAVDRCARLDPALLLRTGNRVVRDRLPLLLEDLAARAVARGPSMHVICGQLETAAAGRQEVHTRLETRTQDEAELAQLLIDVEILRTRLWGQDAALEPRADVAAVAPQVRRAMRRGWFRRRREGRALASAHPTRPSVTFTDVAEWVSAEASVQQLTAALRAAGPADPDRDRQELNDADTAWAAAGTLALRDTVQQRLHSGRAALQHLARLRTVGRSARTQAVARALPTTGAWACTALSAQQTFPLTAGLFDLLVIDEASQCSIAHVLPLAYRARRVVVVGDPNQLTPVVTLDRRSQTRLATSAGWTTEEVRRQALSVGDDSAFTAYAARHRGPPLLLTEHYRCHPAIARFINEQYYGGLLRVLTKVDEFGSGTHGLVLVDTPGMTHPGPYGGAVNHAEADAVVRWILEHPEESGSIGVVTPFAAQRHAIEQRLQRALGPDAAASIRVGTAHRFQGDERDVVLFSPVVAADAGAGTLRWVEEQRNLVNVAVSRARRALVVVADAASIASSPVPTLHALVALARAGAGADDMAHEIHGRPDLHSDAERRLFSALRRAGCTPRLKEVVEGYELDLTLDTPHGPLDVEVDGAHHQDVRGRQRRQDLARDAVLQALGWQVIRVPAWRALAEADVVARELARHVA